MKFKCQPMNIWTPLNYNVIPLLVLGYRVLTSSHFTVHSTLSA